MVVHSRFTRAAVREGSVILDKGYYRLGRLKVESTGFTWTEAWLVTSPICTPHTHVELVSLGQFSFPQPRHSLDVSLGYLVLTNKGKFWSTSVFMLCILTQTSHD